MIDVLGPFLQFQWFANNTNNTNNSNNTNNTNNSNNTNNTTDVEPVDTCPRYSSQLQLRSGLGMLPVSLSVSLLVS